MTLVEDLLFVGLAAAAGRNTKNVIVRDDAGTNIGTAVAGTISGTVGTSRDIQFGLRMVF